MIYYNEVYLIIFSPISNYLCLFSLTNQVLEQWIAIKALLIGLILLNTLYCNFYLPVVLFIFESSNNTEIVVNDNFYGNNSKYSTEFVISSAIDDF